MLSRLSSPVSIRSSTPADTGHCRDLPQSTFTVYNPNNQTTMADAAAPKAKKVAKPAAHPPFKAMIAAAITSLKERGGSSRQAILKHIVANNKVDAAKAAVGVRLALKRGLAKGVVAKAKAAGKGAGKYKLVKVAKPKKVKKPKAKKPKKPKAKKVKKAKKPAAKKPAKKAAKKPAKKAAKKPAAKKPAAKKPAKKAAKKPAAKKAAPKKK